MVLAEECSLVFKMSSARANDAFYRKDTEPFFNVGSPCRLSLFDHLRSKFLITMQYLCISSFVELGGGVDDVLVWRRDGAYVEFGFR